MLSKNETEAWHGRWPTWVGPGAAATPQWTGALMIIPTMLGLIALFAVVSILFSADPTDRRDDLADRNGQLPFWIRFGHH